MPGTDSTVACRRRFMRRPHRLWSRVMVRSYSSRQEVTAILFSGSLPQQLVFKGQSLQSWREVRYSLYWARPPLALLIC